MGQGLKEKNKEEKEKEREKEKEEIIDPELKRKTINLNMPLAVAENLIK